MRIAKINQSIANKVAAYTSRLTGFDAEQFMVAPPMGGWSYSEVYSHIFDSSLLSLMAMQNCINGTGEKKPTAFVVKAILFFRSLPPGKKYKVPKRLVDRVKKISPQAANQMMRDFELQLAKILPFLAAADPKVKTKHPRLGYLNAIEWLRFTEIHLQHHLMQLKRIENSFLHQH